MKTILTGVQSSGTLHFGNYVGAIKPAIELGHAANKSGNRHIMFIANYHALNSLKDPALLKKSIMDAACTYLAAGLDPTKSIFYRQSDVPQIFELATILSNYTPKGFMNKSHAYKAAVDRNTEKNQPADAGINMGLYNYPVLMAADILMFDTDEVPVGKDQIQHVEITQDIAGAVNAVYGKPVFKIPNFVVQPHAQLVPGIDGRKMSKSYGNVIPLFGSDDDLKKAVMGIKTDSQDINAPKNPDDILLYQIAQGVATSKTAAEIKAGLEKGGLGYGHIKKMLLADLIDQITPMREKYNHYLAHFDEVEKMLAVGAEQARAIAAPILTRVKETILG